MVTNATLMTMKARKREIPAGEFKAKCLALFDEVEDDWGFENVLAQMSWWGTWAEGGLFVVIGRVRAAS